MDEGKLMSVCERRRLKEARGLSDVTSTLTSKVESDVFDDTAGGDVSLFPTRSVSIAISREISDGVT